MLLKRFWKSISEPLLDKSHIIRVLYVKSVIGNSDGSSSQDNDAQCMYIPVLPPNQSQIEI